MADTRQPITREELEELMSQQTSTILDALDERISRQDKKIDEMDQRFSQKLEIYLLNTFFRSEKSV